MITLDERGEIVDAVAFLNPDLFAYFGVGRKCVDFRLTTPYHWSR